MPPRGGGGRSRGSRDEVNVTLTGKEWIGLLKYVNKKWMYGVVLFFRVIRALLSKAMAIVEGRLATVLIDSDFSTAAEFMDAVNDVAAQMMITITIVTIVNLLSQYTSHKFSPLLLKDFRVGLMTQLLSQDIEFYDETHTGVILSRLTEDVPAVHDTFATSLTWFVELVFEWISGLAICLFYSWKVTLIAALALPVQACITRFGKSMLDNLWNEASDKAAVVSTKADEILKSFRTVRSMDAEMREAKAYEEKIEDVNKVRQKESLIGGVRSMLASFVLWGVTCFVMYYTGLQAVRGEIASGDIITLMSVIQAWNSVFSQITSVYMNIKKTNVPAFKILQILDREPKIKMDRGAALNRRVSGKVEFRNVCFKYASRQEYALDDLSFTISPGETVAIVGESGCGKSTTLQLIQRFYDIEKGQILVDGMDIRDISPIELRSQIATVPQSPVMFSMNVKDNIRFGMVGAPSEDVVKAAKVANAHEFIVQLKDGYKTVVQQNSLSGGQKQRICIARAVLMDPQILLLDEATAALDTESERLVQDALNHFRSGRTVIIVAHRLATIRHADRILVMQKGKLLESGTHDQLMAAGGAYADLVRHQLQ